MGAFAQFLEPSLLLASSLSPLRNAGRIHSGFLLSTLSYKAHPCAAPTLLCPSLSCQLLTPTSHPASLCSPICLSHPRLSPPPAPQPLWPSGFPQTLLFSFLSLLFSSAHQLLPLLLKLLSVLFSSCAEVALDYLQSFMLSIVL